MPEIFVIDGRDVPNPEDVAMLQALYSRSPRSVVEHLAKVREKGSKSFHEVYYVQYGHKSIGDCGFTAMFIEQVSLLAAKAIQDTPLYCGQEASTRYLDMSKQAVLNPLGTAEGARIQSQWMQLYAYVLEVLIPSLKERFPRAEGEKESVWEKAIKAKAFDVARGFLPAGVTTLVAWSANLRQANDHTKELRHHVLPEVRDIGNALRERLRATYPSSFGHKTYPEEEAYIAKSMERFSFYDADYSGFSCSQQLNLHDLLQERELLETRPPRAELHQRFRQYGSLTFKFLLDFGSYRDLQRQRSAVQEMPLLSMRHGFHRWYTDQLPDSVKDNVETQLADLAAQVVRLPTDEVTKQYYTAIGFNVPVKLTCSLPSAVYIAELRSGPTVHPTLRVIAQQMGDAIQQAVPGIAVHHDKSPDVWSTKRGTQDIAKRV